MPDGAPPRAGGSRRRSATYLFAIVGLAGMAIALCAGAQEVTAMEQGRGLTACGSVYDNPDYARALGSFFDDAENCDRALARALAATLASGASGALALAVATVRLASGRRSLVRA